jgi:hypothetical protein
VPLLLAEEPPPQVVLQPLAEPPPLEEVPPLAEEPPPLVVEQPLAIHLNLLENSTLSIKLQPALPIVMVTALVVVNFLLLPQIQFLASILKGHAGNDVY